MAKVVQPKYEPPEWAGKSPRGCHLDVVKDSKLIQKLMVDVKGCYTFGRNPEMVDFVVDHSSCSRLHAALVYHSNLNRFFLIDLGSTHGTFIGTMPLQKNKPTPLPEETAFHFGASTRNYVVREAKRQMAANDEVDNKNGEGHHANLLGIDLPKTEAELDDLTEFNTAINRQRQQGLPTEAGMSSMQPVKRKKASLTFMDDVHIINPEDCDPTIGRFRDMVESTVVVKNGLKSASVEPGDKVDSTELDASHHTMINDINEPHDNGDGLGPSLASGYITSLYGDSLVPLPNPAPVVYMPQPVQTKKAKLIESHAVHVKSTDLATAVVANIPVVKEHISADSSRKKYAKESWPGR